MIGGSETFSSIEFNSNECEKTQADTQRERMKERKTDREEERLSSAFKEAVVGRSTLLAEFHNPFQLFSFSFSSVPLHRVAMVLTVTTVPGNKR